MSRSALLKIWKNNVVESKWLNVKNYDVRFSEQRIERNIDVLESFFHSKDLDLKNSQHIHDVDFSENWLNFILIQKNLGTIYLVFELCNVIDFYKSTDVNYLKHKLLRKDGRVLKDFRNKYFEVYFNYSWLKSGIVIDLKKCYRNKFNPNSEGYDSCFKFKKKNYIVECLKVKSQFEIQTRASYKLTQILYKSIQKNQILLKELPIFIFALLADGISNIESEFNKIFNEALKKGEFDKTKVYRYKSKVFKNLIILSDIEKIKHVKEKYNVNKDYIELKIELKGFEYLDKNKKEVGINITEDVLEYRKYRISSSYTIQKSNKEFEIHLLSKINKKIKQINKEVTRKYSKIVAVELESYNGFGKFQYDFRYSFPEIKKISQKDLIIILYFKDSSENNLQIERKIFHIKNDSLVKYLSTGILIDNQ